jgi:hypothetical protein
MYDITTVRIDFGHMVATYQLSYQVASLSGNIPHACVCQEMTDAKKPAWLAGLYDNGYFRI